MVALSVLREAQPDAFALIHDHLYYLRSKPSREERPNAEKAWNESLAALTLDERSREAVSQVIGFAFESDEGNQKPQGVWHHNHADYWERFLAVPRLAESERDQPVLQLMLKKDDSTLLDLLEDGRRSPAVEDFRHLLDRSQVERLLVPLVERRSREPAGQWPDHDPPGFLPLWRMWNRRAERGELAAATAWREFKLSLEIALPRNLALTAELQHHFATTSNGVPDLLQEGEHSYRDEAKQYLRTLLVATYSGNEGELVRALDGAPTPTLLWLAWGLDRIRSHDLKDIPFDGWAGLAATILKAASVDRRIMLPQIAALVTDQLFNPADGAGVRYHYNEERAGRLFGDANIVLDLFGGEARSQWTDPHVTGVLVARKMASETDGQDTSPHPG